MKNRRALAQSFAAAGYRIGAEIGVAEGYYARVLCDAIPGLHLYLVDPWDGRGGRDEATFRRACDALQPFHVQVIRKASVDAAADISDGALDFVFIDAAHDYDSVAADLQAWAPKVRSGGVVSGHDYYTLKGSPVGGVVNAVDAYVRTAGVTLQTTGWDRTQAHRDDWQPCWWFVQPEAA